MPTLTRLNITNCIVIGDARRLENGKDPVRNIRGLSFALEALKPYQYDADKICRLLYRSNLQGVMEVSDELREDLKTILMVKDAELIKYAPG